MEYGYVTKYNTVIKKTLKSKNRVCNEHRVHSGRSEEPARIIDGGEGNVPRPTCHANAIK